MRRTRVEVHAVRIFDGNCGCIAGTRGAVPRDMRPEETWTIPLQIIMWAVIAIGVIMALAVLMMH